MVQSQWPNFIEAGNNDKYGSRIKVWIRHRQPINYNIEEQIEHILLKLWRYPLTMLKIKWLCSNRGIKQTCNYLYGVET